MRLVALMLIIALLAGCFQDEQVADDTGPAPRDYGEPDADILAHLQDLRSFPEMRFETDFGTIRMLLYTGWTPTTAEHIQALVEQGFYNDTLIHRVVDDFVIQGGDPTGTGEGGSGPLGTSDPVPLEIHDGPVFGGGAVGLARWTDDTGDSQWFIVEKPALHLNDPQGTTGDVFGAYSLFAQVFEGMEVVRQIATVDTIDGLDRPVEDVHLQGATMHAPPTDADLLGLYPVAFPFQFGQGAGELERPKYVFEDHRATFTAYFDTGACNAVMPAQLSGNNVTFTIDMWVVQGDICTYQYDARLDPGEWTFRAGGTQEDGGPPTEHTFTVVPWHPDYAGFRG